MDKFEEKTFIFKITLRGTKTPMVWRRIHVPATSTFHQLHHMILISMNWSGGHHHQFVMKRPGSRQTLDFAPKTTKYAEFWKTADYIDENDARIFEYFNTKTRNATYTYDFVDDWKHAIRFERCSSKKVDGDRRRCVAGGGICPPEDCGGAERFYELLEILRNPEHGEHESIKEKFLNWDLTVDDLSAKFNPKSVCPREIDLNSSFYEMLGLDY